MYEPAKDSKLISTLFILSVIITTIVSFTPQVLLIMDTNSTIPIEYITPQNTILSSYIEHNPIIITSNADFESQGFPGNGTKGDPYMISNYNITATETCIFIQHTDVYFVIRDCLIAGKLFGGLYANIKFQNVTHGEIRNNTISQKENGILLQTLCSNNVIANNTIFDNSYGINLANTRNNSIVNNTIFGNWVGIAVSSYPESTISANILTNNGLILAYSGIGGISYPQNITSDNIVNGKLLGYFCNLRNVTIDGNEYGQVILVNCTGVTVQNGVFLRASVGLLLAYSSHCNLINNTSSGNAGSGIHLYMSHNNTIVNNTAANSYAGLYFHYASNNTAIDNHLFRNIYEGISLWGVSNKNLFYYNVISHNMYQNAYDNDGNNNHWNTTGIGNYWSDYGGTGVYTVGDTSIDYHPFTLLDSSSPIIDHPADIEYGVGVTGNLLQWTPSDVHPSHYVIFRNDVQEFFAIWDGSSIIIGIDDLAIGSYEYRIEVYDLFGNMRTDIVVVNVVSSIPTSTITYTTTTTTTTTTSETSTTTTSSTTTSTSTTTSITETDTETTTSGSGNPLDSTTVFLALGGIGLIIVVIILVKLRK